MYPYIMYTMSKVGIYEHMNYVASVQTNFENINEHMKIILEVRTCLHLQHLNFQRSGITSLLNVITQRTL
jgi:hypothetical protein